MAKIIQKIKFGNRRPSKLSIGHYNFSEEGYRVEALVCDEWRLVSYEPTRHIATCIAADLRRDKFDTKSVRIIEPF